MQRKTIQFKLKVKESHGKAVGRFLLILSDFYNHFLDERIKTYKESVKTLSAYDQQKSIRTIRDQFDPEHSVHVHLVQDTTRRLDLAFQHFFRRVKENKKGLRKKAPGFPRPKTRERYRSLTFKEHGNGFKVIQKDGMVSKIKMTHIGSVPVHNRFRLPEGSVVHTGTLIRKADGLYFSLTYSHPLTAPVLSTKAQPLFPYSTIAYKPVKQREVGIDVGVRDFLTTSDGEKINCSYLESEFQKLRGLNKRLRHKRSQLKRQNRNPEESRRYRTLRDQTARQHLRIFRIRQDFQNKLAAYFTQNYQALYVEQLNVQGLIGKSFSRNHSRKVHQAAWTSFFSKLDYRAANAGVLFQKVDPSWTSQICSDCLSPCPKDLSVREHHCLHCGYRADRDHNAARNIQHLGRDPESLSVPKAGLREAAHAASLMDEAPSSLR